MNVLVLGSGAREHTITWKVSKSSQVDKIFVIPGNPGMQELAECIDGDILDFAFLEKIIKDKNIDLIIPGPEVPLVSGLVDYFAGKDVMVFGPDKKAAQLEGSKCFSKDILRKYNIPTARYENFDTTQKALDYVGFLAGEKDYPVVIKADGLAAGKGAVIVHSRQEAENTISEIMVKKVFGNAGNRVVVEEFLRGFEVSLHLVVSGNTYKFLPFSQDHKQVFDGDKGPNTGGMGAYAPCPLIDDKMKLKIEKEIIKPLLQGFEKDGICYKGILYIGLMICDGKPFVLEFNVRLGDPETQVLLPLIDTDFVEIAVATVKDKLEEINVRMKDGVAIGITCASKGYPNAYEKGISIYGLDDVKGKEDILVFHAGTKIGSDGKILTNGGRVLTFVVFDKTLKLAIEKAYKNIEKISFDGSLCLSFAIQIGGWGNEHQLRFKTRWHG